MTFIKCFTEAVFFLCVCLNLAAGSIIEEFFFKPTTCPGKILTSTDFYRTFSVSGKIKCAIECRKDTTCVSFLYDHQACSLGSDIMLNDCTNGVSSSHGSYYETIQDLEEPPCFNGGYLVGSDCVCINGYVSTRCERLMTDCSEGFTYSYYASMTAGKVVMWVHPPTSPTPFQVKCWFVWGGRTYFQNRDDANVDFFRTWTEYRDGFGDITGDYWLGLTKLYYLTNHKDMRLEYETYDQNWNYIQEYADKFRIKDEANNFAVETVYSEYGDLGPCMTETLGKPFSAHDNDMDDDPAGNCANKFQSGWWFGSCTSCNPNGPITRPASGQRQWIDAEAFLMSVNISPYGMYMWLTKPYGM